MSEAFSSLTSQMLGIGDGVDAHSYLHGQMYHLWESMLAHGGDPTGVADSDDALHEIVADLPAQGGLGLLPPGNWKYSTTLDLAAGDTLSGLAVPNRWQGSFGGTRLTYVGTGPAIRIRSTSGVVDNVALRDIDLYGGSAGASADGLLIDVTTGTAVEGVLLERVTIRDFPRYCVSSSGLVFDVICRHCSFNNYVRIGLGGGTADNLVNIVSVAGSSQFTFDDCYLVQYNAAKWCYYGGGTDCRFDGGTVAPQLNANGIRQSGGLTVLGTHVEGVSNTGVGIRVVGANGRLIVPGSLEGFATGLQVGDPDFAASSTFGTTVMGGIGNNTTDIQIVAGGSRRGTMLLPFGDPAGPITIVNDRESTDGTYDEVVYLDLLHTAGVLDLRGTVLRFRDANLYRSAADVLKTDDRFVAVGGVDTRVVATGSLPAAAASMDGHVLIEDAGAGNRNLIIYAGGERFRIDGGAAV